MDHGASAQKQEALEQGVIDRVQCGARESQDRHGRCAIGQTERAGAHAYQDDPNILHTVEREKALDVVLRERPDDAEDA